MKRLLTLAIWLALCIPCAGSTYIAQITENSASTGNNNLTVGVPAATVNNDTLLFCVWLDGSATVTTLGGTFTSCPNFASLSSVTNSTFNMKCGCRVASSEPANYVPTWTGSVNSKGIMIDLKSTDGSTPGIDVTPTTGGAATQITTVTDNDLIIDVIMDNTGNAGTITGTAEPLSIPLNIQNRHVLVASQKTAGTTTWQPAAITFSGAGTVLGTTIAVKSNTTTAVNFVGRGTVSYNSGSAASVSPAVPTNANTGDVLFANITEKTNTAIAITPPTVPDIQLFGHQAGSSAGSGCTSTGTHSCTVTSPTGMPTGAMEVAFYYSGVGNTLTDPSGWTTQTHINSVVSYSCSYHVAGAGQGGASRTFTSNAGSVLVWYAVFVSTSGGTMGIDNCALTSNASTSSWPAPAVTTTGANRLIFVNWLDGNQPTIATTETVIDNIAAMAGADAWHFQAASGASTTPAATFSSPPQAYAAGSMAISSGGAAGPSWTSVTSKANESATAQENVYSLIEPSAQVVTQAMPFAFASNPGSSEGSIVAFSNVNTTTPADSTNTLANEGLAQAMEAALPKPSSTDEMVMNANGYAGCTPSTGGVNGTTNTNAFWPQVLVSGSISTVYYTTPDYAMASQQVDQCGGAYASVALGLNAATTPTATSAALRINQQIEHIFNTAPAPAPPGSGWHF